MFRSKIHIWNYFLCLYTLLSSLRQTQWLIKAGASSFSSLFIRKYSNKIVPAITRTIVHCLFHWILFDNRLYTILTRLTCFTYILNACTYAQFSTTIYWVEPHLIQMRRLRAKRCLNISLIFGRLYRCFTNTAL